jgi:hypothetical protein
MFLVILKYFLEKSLPRKGKRIFYFVTYAGVQAGGTASSPSSQHFWKKSELRKEINIQNINKN